MPFKILINTHTTGVAKEINIAGRPHLVSRISPIVGDITMNGKLYPDADVASSFMQFNNMQCPSGHPIVNGVGTSINHPVANNKHNIGGFMRNSKKSGKRVNVEYCLDISIANNSDDGIETMRRMRAGEKIGVSTGLTAATEINQSGVDDFNVPYTSVLHGYTFDHVATLLNESAAGEHAGTEMLFNAEGAEVEFEVANLVINELSSDDIESKINDMVRAPFRDSDTAHAWVSRVFPESKTFIFSVFDGSGRKSFKQSYAIDQNDSVTLLDDKVEGEVKDIFVEKQPEQQPTTQLNQKVDIMDKQALALAIIANTANSYGVGDNEKLMAMDDSGLASIISANPLTVENAKDTLKSEFDFPGYDNFIANKSGFEAYQASEQTRLGVLRTGITTNNADYTAEMLADKGEAELLVINAMADPKKVATRIPEGGAPNITNSESDGKAVLDFTQGA